MNNNSILIYSKSNYGHTQWYVNAPHDVAVNGLTGKKTVDKRDIRNLIALGFNVFDKITNKQALEVME